MNIGGLHQRFKNRIGVSNGYEDLLPVEIDSKLNEAQNWIVTKYGDQSANRSYIKNLLAPFYKSIDVTFTPIVNSKEYSVNLPDDLVYVEKLTYTCSSNNSPSKVSIVTLDEIDGMRGDELQKPNKLFNRSLAIVQDGQLRVYTEQTLTKGKLVYLRKPKPVFFGGYDTTDYTFCIENSQGNCDQFYNQSTDPQNSEFLETHQELIVDIAVFLESGKIINSAINQIIGQKITN